MSVLHVVYVILGLVVFGLPAGLSLVYLMAFMTARGWFRGRLTATTDYYKEHRHTYPLPKEHCDAEDAKAQP